MKLSRFSDEELMHRFQKGDEKSYYEIVARYKDKLLNHIFFYVKNREAAEDIIQDAFVRVYLNKDKYKDLAKVSTWIYTIAINLAKTEINKSSRAEKFSITGKNGEKDFELPDKHNITDEPVLKKELKETLMSAIESLDDKFREIILLRDIDGLSYEEIAEVLEIPVGTVKSRINRARLNIRELVSGYMN